MRYLAFATDYDGTLATEGVVQEETVEALEKVKESGRRLVLVTGREVGDLESVFPRLALFDQVVAENGGLLFEPETGGEKRLAGPPSPVLLDALRHRGVAPLSVGRVVVATRQPHEQTVREAIRDSGLALQVALNKGAVMVLPAGVDKGTGLAAALQILGVPLARCIGVGDAENDSAFLKLCGYSIALANAVLDLKEKSDWITPDANGSGVRELIDLLLKDLLPLRD